MTKFEKKKIKESAIQRKKKAKARKQYFDSLAKLKPKSQAELRMMAIKYRTEACPEILEYFGIK